jgi:chromosome segregation ATPase
MGPQIPSTAQVEAALQSRISGLERVVQQTEFDLAAQKQQTVVLRERLSEGASRLLALDQELTAVDHQLAQAQAGRDDAEAALAVANAHSGSLTTDLATTRAQVGALTAEVGATLSQVKQLRAERDQLAARVAALEEALRLEHVHTSARP